MDDSTDVTVTDPLIGTIRDPNALNQHVMIRFDDIIGEPPTAESTPCVWEKYERIFNGSKDCCYKGMTAVFGIPCAMLWGVKSACLSFNTIWCTTPSVRAAKIYLKSLGGIYSNFVQCICDPVCSSVGLMLSKIKVIKE